MGVPEPRSVILQIPGAASAPFYLKPHRNLSHRTRAFLPQATYYVKRSSTYAPQLYDAWAQLHAVMQQADFGHEMLWAWPRVWPLVQGLRSGFGQQAYGLVVSCAIHPAVVILGGVAWSITDHLPGSPSLLTAGSPGSWHTVTLWSVVPKRPAVIFLLQYCRWHRCIGLAHVTL